MARIEEVVEEHTLRRDRDTRERVHMEQTQIPRRGPRSPRHQSTQRMLHLLPLGEIDQEFATIATNPDTTHTSAQKNHNTGRKIRNTRARKVAAHHRTHLGRENYKEIRPIKTAMDSVIFSIDFTELDNSLPDNHILLDTCAGESVFRTDNLFYDIITSRVPLLVSGVNSRGDLLVITEYGNTDFGIVYYDPNCIANILSFGNMVNNSFSVSYDSKRDFYSLQIVEVGCCNYFHRDKKHYIYM